MILSFRGVVPGVTDGSLVIEEDAVILDSDEIVGMHATRPFRPVVGGPPKSVDDFPTPIECTEIMRRGGDGVIVAHSRVEVMERWFDAWRGEVQHRRDTGRGMPDLPEWPERADGTKAFPEQHEKRFGGKRT